MKRIHRQIGAALLFGGLLHPGIDLVYYGNQEKLEYDFVVKPDANPKKIALSFEGAPQVKVDRSGELALTTDGGDVRWRKPVVYQEINGKRHALAGNYVLLHGSSLIPSERRLPGRPLRPDPWSSSPCWPTLPMLANNSN